MAGLYSYYLPPLVLTPAMINLPQSVNTGNRLGGWLVIQNNSPYKIQVGLPGSANVLPLDPQTVDKFQVNTGDQVISVLPLALLPTAAPSSQVDVQVYPGPDPENEPPGQYPIALARQTVQSNIFGPGGGYSFATFDISGGSVNVTVATAPAGESVYIGGFDLTCDTSLTGVHTVLAELTNIDPAFSNTSTLIWRQAALQSTPLQIFRTFPGPLKGKQGQGVGVIATDSSGGVIDVNIPYFIAAP